MFDEFLIQYFYQLELQGLNIKNVIIGMFFWGGYQNFGVNAVFKECSFEMTLN